MLSKNKIKHFNSLSLNKFRQQHQEFILEGTKSVEELLKSDFTIKEIIATAEWVQQHPLVLKAIPTEVVTDREMQQISQMKTPPGVLALVAIPTVSWKLNQGFTLILDGINDPGNLGTIIRTADWFGIENIVCSHDTVDVYHPKVVQATMGSIFRVNVFYENLESVLIAARQNDVAIYGAVMNGENIFSSDLKFSSALLVIGSESHGIREPLLPLITHPITYPKFGTKAVINSAESLNAAIATALILGIFIPSTQG
ncbi:MAG: RNA methyltransferase [Bacteroidales bacterium]|nr:RNA methyltransferase [Bacteroidales bacterium]